jgi:hypothetical protein
MNRRRQLKIMSDRISLATQFTGKIKHLKRKVKSLLKSRGVGHVMQTTKVNDDEKLLSLFMEGESMLFSLK